MQSALEETFPDFFPKQSTETNFAIPPTMQQLAGGYVLNKAKQGGEYLKGAWENLTGGDVLDVLGATVDTTEPKLAQIVGGIKQHLMESGRSDQFTLRELDRQLRGYYENEPALDPNIPQQAPPLAIDGQVVDPTWGTEQQIQQTLRNFGVDKPVVDPREQFILSSPAVRET